MLLLCIVFICIHLYSNNDIVGFRYPIDFQRGEIKEKVLQNGVLTEKYCYYISDDEKEVKHGIYRRFSQTYNKIITDAVYVDGKEHGLCITFGYFPKFKSYRIFNNGVVISSYTVINGKKVSFFNYKNDEPYNGTSWIYSTGLGSKGFEIRECQIITYKDGKIVKRQESDFHGNILPEGKTIEGKTLAECLDKDELEELKKINEKWRKEKLEKKKLEQKKDLNSKEIPK